MSVIKILIVEDELLVAENLKERLVDFGYAITGQAANAIDAIKAFKKLLPDLVLLDIDLGQGQRDGIDIAHELNALHTVPIIYLTAHSNSTTIERAKATRPTAYLVKPIRASQLRAALEIALYNFSQQIIPDPSHRRIKAPLDSIYPLQDAFFIRDSKRILRKVDVSNLIYVEAKGSAVELQFNNRTLTIHANLSSFLRQIPHPYLIRVHRSFVVNLRLVDGIEESLLLLQDHTIPLGKTYKEQVLQLFRLLKAD